MPYCQDESPPNIVQPSMPDSLSPEVCSDKKHPIQDGDDLPVVQHSDEHQQDTPLMTPPVLSPTDEVADKQVEGPRRSGRARVKPERLNI